MNPMTTVPISPELVRGALELERTDRGLAPHRLPAWARAQGADGQLLMAESQPSGVRLVLRTAATAIELDTIPTKRVYAGVPPRPDGLYDVVVDGELVAQGSVAGGDTLTIDMTTGAFSHASGDAGTLRVALPETTAERDVEIWLPHDETTLLVALRADAPVHAADPGSRRTWVHHGSSISHGSNATHPTGTWPAVAARAAGLDLVNLGYGGSALLDPFVARTIHDSPADLISVKIGINLVNLDLMRLRGLAPAVHGFLDTIRDGHPTTPLLVVSPFWCGIHEDTPGPTAPDLEAMAEGRIAFRATGDPADAVDAPHGRLSLRVIRRELERIVAQRAAHDPHLTYVDGLRLYGEADAATLPLTDALHPDAATHELIGARFAAIL